MSSQNLLRHFPTQTCTIFYRTSELLHFSVLRYSTHIRFVFERTVGKKTSFEFCACGVASFDPKCTNNSCRGLITAAKADVKTGLDVYLGELAQQNLLSTMVNLIGPSCKGELSSIRVVVLPKCIMLIFEYKKIWQKGSRYQLFLISTTNQPYYLFIMFSKVSLI